MNRDGDVMIGDVVQIATELSLAYGQIIFADDHDLTIAMHVTKDSDQVYGRFSIAWTDIKRINKLYYPE